MTTRRYKRLFPLIVFVLLCTRLSYSVTVVVDADEKKQYFEGWGTSLCWWAVLTGQWDEDKRDELIGAIVDPDSGLGYTIFRYNIGGGDQPGHDHLTKGDGGAKVPGFKPSEDGPYDWEADPHQRNILLGIKQRVPDAIFEAFSNSPPWWMTKSGCVSGSSDGSDNLKEDYFDDFADYLSEVVKQYRDSWGVTFRTVEPFNEPGAGWWKANGTQEGCGFRNNQSRMITELGRALVEKDLFPATSVSAADESSIERALASLEGYDSTALSYMSQVNTHSYSGYNSRSSLREAVSSRGKRLWQSESGPLHKSDDSHVALWMADVIIQDLRTMEAEAWVDWQVSDPATNWRSIDIDNANQQFTYTARFYMHAAFSRFIRPGSRIIATDNGNTVAALTPEGTVVIVVRNGTSSDEHYTFDLSGFSETGTNADVYRFSLPGSLAAQPDVPVDDAQLSIQAPAQTVTTCVVPVSCIPPTLNAYAKIDDNPWQETNTVTLDVGDSLRFGPQPIGGGTWHWEGPQGFTSDSREILLTDIDESQAGNYTASFTDAPGCTSSIVHTVAVTPSVSISSMHTATDYNGAISLTRHNTLFIGDNSKPVTVRIYDLRGVSMYSRILKNPGSISIQSIVPNGTYIVKVHDSGGQTLFKGIVYSM